MDALYHAYPYPLNSTKSPNSTIHAFEPVPELYEKVVNNTESCRNIYCYPFALGDCSSNADFYISSGDSDGWSSLLLPNKHLIEHPGVRFDVSIRRVKTMTLESWAEANNVAYVYFLWLDMQGYELHALKSACLLLSTVRAICTQVSLKEMYHGALLYGERRQWLCEQGFRVHMEALPWEDMGNVLFVRSSLQV